MTFLTPGIIDISIILILGISIFVGVMRGATREVLGIAGWVGAFATVFFGLPLFRPLGRYYIHSPMLADMVVAILLFILSLGVFILISRTVSSRVKGSLLGGLDRSFGLVFGFVRGALVICLIYLALGFFYPSAQLPAAIQNAHFTPWVAQGAYELKYLIPQDYLPQNLMPVAINPIDAKDLLENSLPTLEDTVKHLSTLKPKKPIPALGDMNLEKLIEKNDLPTQK
jgi:membrane protein required for colicin V production